jgi:hypothetical protein
MKIGTPPTSWNTTPEPVVVDVPGEAVIITTKPKLYVQVASTDPNMPAAPASTHRWRTTFNIWMVDKDMRGVIQLKSDVLRAIYAAEPTFFTMFQSMPFPTSFSLNNSMNTGGSWLGLQQVQIDYETSHTSP